MLKLTLLVDSGDFQDDNKVQTRADFLKKREIDRSALYISDGTFQLIHADIGNFEFLGKGATIPKYVLLVVNLYSSKIYAYPTRLRK